MSELKVREVKVGMTVTLIRSRPSNGEILIEEIWEQGAGLGTVIVGSIVETNRGWSDRFLNPESVEFVHVR